MKKGMITSFTILMAIGIGYMAMFYDPFSGCPFTYRFEYETNCWLRDERQGTKLIELFNYEDNQLWLAKIDSKVSWLEHPEKHIDTYKNHIPENKIIFKDDNLDTLIVNGVVFPVTVLEKRP